jgi:hypothetical protein
MTTSQKIVEQGEVARRALLDAEGARQAVRRQLGWNPHETGGMADQLGKSYEARAESERAHLQKPFAAFVDAGGG